MSAATDAIAAARQPGQPARAETAKRTRAAKAPRAEAPAPDIRIGAEPRVDLLPAEIRAARRHENIVRRMIIGLVVAVAVVIVAALGANALALTAGVSLAAEQARGTQLLQEQQRYTSLRATQSELALVKAAQAVGGATDIDWAAVGNGLIATLPAGAAVTNVSMDAATPIAPYQQSLVPGAAPRVASATVTISAPNLEAVSQWFASIRSMKNVIETSAGATTIQSGGTYQAIATVYFGAGAWDGKYLPTTEGK